MMFTTPVHFRIGRRSSGLNRAKQYPGNSGQSIFFLRSFQRLHLVTVGRNTSTCFCWSCSRTTCSCRERVQSANQRTSRSLAVAVTGASTPTDEGRSMNRRSGRRYDASAGGGRGNGLSPARQRKVVRALQLVVPPGNARLRAKAIEVRLKSRAALALGDAIPDRGARLLERAHFRVGARLELENLIPARRPDQFSHLADLELVEHL